MLSLDTPADVYKLLLYFDLHWIRHFIMFRYYSSKNSAYITNFESISLWYILTQLFTAVKYIYNLPKLSIYDTKQTLKYEAISGVGRSLWGRSWLWLKLSGFRNLKQYTTVTNQCKQFPLTWTWRIQYSDRWYHF